MNIAREEDQVACPPNNQLNNIPEETRPILMATSKRYSSKTPKH